MLMVPPNKRTLFLLIVVGVVRVKAGLDGLNEEHFCRLEGNVDDCTCSPDTVDHFNNVKVFPRLRSLLVKNYFRFFKVNLKRECPFWADDSRCAMRHCHVKACNDEDIPIGIKGSAYRSMDDKNCQKKLNDEDKDLDFLNKTISAKTKHELAMWAMYDDAQDNFCIIDENDEEAEYVDLLLNPERFTGYKGESAHRIWNSIYMENCFRPKLTYNLYIQGNKLNNMCLEKRAYYRAISGLHSSINIHLCGNYLLSKGLSLTDAKEGDWGPNLAEFQRRFSPETTNGEGPNWLKNLYFIYLLELRALAKAADYLQSEEFYTGDESEDWDTKMAIKDLLSLVKQFPHHFDETSMFTGSAQAQKLKREFKEHFRNVTRIMDCVGCDKCKLWGKLQTKGLGTALKILFSGNDIVGPNFEKNNKRFQLTREEIVALFNAFGRLSTSIYKLDDFREMLRNDEGAAVPKKASPF